MEYGNPASLVTPLGTLTFNGGGDGLRLSGVSGMGGASVRAPIDSTPQRDGAILHRFFYGARHVTLEGQVKAATLAARATLLDDLKGHAHAILRADGRLYFTPTGLPERFVTVRLAEPVQIGGGPGPVKTFQLALVSGDPYAYGAAEIETVIADGATTAIANDGNAPNYAVFKVYGPCTSFTITNGTSGKLISASGLSLGGGEYAEIVTAWETIYKNGDGANLLGYLDFAADDMEFFPLNPGSNSITFDADDGAASLTVLSNHAWV